MNITELKKIAERQLEEYHATMQEIEILRAKRKKIPRQMTEYEAFMLAKNMDPGRHY